MSIRILIFKNGVITPARTSDDNTAIINSLGSGFVTSVNGSTGAITLTKSSVGLPLADNTSDLNKPISTATQSALNLKADLVNGLIPSSQLPGYVDDVLEFATLSSFPTTGESGKIYIAIDTQLTYRWTGSVYSNMSSSLALGITSTTAYRGDYGNIAYNHSQIVSGNPHGVTAALINLGNVDNTSDVNKPVSTATQTALNLKAPLASPTFTGTVSGITAAMVGLGNVNNTSDLSKPISTATQTALDLKANLISPSLSGTPTAPTATAGTNTTQIATTAFVLNAVAGGGSTTSFVDLSSNQTINGTKIFSGILQLPNNSGTLAGAIWRSGDNLEYKDGANVTKILLNSAGNLSNLMNKQTALNNLVGAQAVGKVLRSDGTNTLLAHINVGTDVTGVLNIANGGTGSATQNFVDLTTNQTIAGIKTFSGTLIVPSSAGTTVGTVWRNVDNLEYKDGANVTKIILNSAGNLSNLSNKQTALNNLVGTQTANRVLRSNGTNTILAQIELTTDVTGILPIANGGTGSSTQNFVDFSSVQSLSNKSFSNNVIGTSFRAGTATIGSISLTQGGSVNAGYLEVFKGNGTTRLGYIGFDNTNLTYITENSAIHSFNGGRVDVTGTIVPPTTSSRLSFFLSGDVPYAAYICSSAPANYKAYDVCNETGTFSIRRILDGYAGIAGYILRHTADNILTLGNSGTRAASGFGSITIEGQLGTYAGINFPAAADSPIFMLGINSRHHGVWSPNAPSGWHWIYNAGNFSVRAGVADSEGTYIGLNKGLGALPGYPTFRHPTIITDYTTLYFSVQGAYSAHMTSNGVLSAVSDKDKKTVVEKMDRTVLDKIARLPVNRYSFKNEDQRITHIGTFAQDFWREFQCGGNQEIIDDDSPIMPNKMLAPADVAGVCLAGIQALIIEFNNLKLEMAKK